MRTVLLVLLSLPGFFSLAQTGTGMVEYFDEALMPVASKEKSKYYRIVEKSGDKFLVKRFFTSNDKIQLEAECSQVTPQMIFSGPMHYFREDGSPEKIVLRQGKDIKYIQWWTKSGEQALTKGSGEIMENNEFGYLVHSQIKDSVAYVSYYARPDKGDTIYNVTTKPAEFSAGMGVFYQKLGLRLKYPDEALRDGIEGTVYVKFIVNKTGQLEEVKTTRGINAACNHAAESAIKSVPNWTPAQFEGRAVKQQLTLPVVFKIEE